MALSARAERHRLREPFRISRIEITHSQMLVAELAADGRVGRGECEPHESDAALAAQALRDMQALAPRFAQGVSREELNRLLPAGPIRNALDCALWDLQAKLTGTPVAQLAGLPAPRPLPTVFTLGIGDPQVGASKARALADWTRFKVKLGGVEAARDLERVQAIHAARPDAELIVDANGGWSLALLQRLAPALAELGVKLIEQPLLPGADEALAGYASPVPLCADESCLDRGSLARVLGRYQYVNIKLDKTGGLTEALALATEARQAGLGLMVGCMTGTSLAMAPAHLVAQQARFIDLDGPMLLAEDRPHGMRYQNGIVFPAERELWG